MSKKIEKKQNKMQLFVTSPLRWITHLTATAREASEILKIIEIVIS